MKKYCVVGGKFSSILAMLTLALLLLVAGSSLSCQYGAPTRPPPPPAPKPAPEPSPGTSPGAEIIMDGFVFTPATLNVAAGTTVTWRNADVTGHTVTGQGKMFDSGSLLRGATFSYTFTQNGTFEYDCVFHPSMTGKVIVK